MFLCFCDTAPAGNLTLLLLCEGRSPGFPLILLWTWGEGGSLSLLDGDGSFSFPCGFQRQLHVLLTPGGLLPLERSESPWRLLWYYPTGMGVLHSSRWKWQPTLPTWSPWTLYGLNGLLLPGEDENSNSTLSLLWQHPGEGVEVPCYSFLRLEA